MIENVLRQEGEQEIRMTADEVRLVIERLSADAHSGLPTTKEVAEAANVDEDQVRQILSDIRGENRMPLNPLISSHSLRGSWRKTSMIVLSICLAFGLAVFLVSMISLVRKPSELPRTQPIEIARFETPEVSEVPGKESAKLPESRPGPEEAK
jgi:hypothetical protein